MWRPRAVCTGLPGMALAGCAFAAACLALALGSPGQRPPPRPGQMGAGAGAPLRQGRAASLGPRWAVLRGDLRWGRCDGEPLCVVARGLRLRGGGIAGFQRWFLSEFPEAAIKVYDGDGDTFDHVAFDMNGLLHSACLKAKTLEHAVLRIFRELDATLRILQPRKSVVLAFDGPGPLAKLLTQRKRRLKASRQSKYKMSGLNITPGTEFMLAVRRACEYFAASRVASSYRFKDAVFYISGSDVAGEGEVKIIEWLHLMRRCINIYFNMHRVKLCTDPWTAQRGAAAGQTGQLSRVRTSWSGTQGEKEESQTGQLSRGRASCSLWEWRTARIEEEKGRGGK